MTLAEAFSTYDMNDLIERMTAYAYDELKCYGIKDLQGIEAFDLVEEVILKVTEGDRDWVNAKCSFPEFLFGCLRSHLSAFRKKFKNRFSNDISDVAATDETDVTQVRRFAIEQLKLDGADEHEVQVFECLADGLNKPAEIAKELNMDVATINNVFKRLKRKLTNIRPKIKSFV